MERLIHTITAADHGRTSITDPETGLCYSVYRPLGTIHGEYDAGRECYLQADGYTIRVAPPTQFAQRGYYGRDTGGE